MKKATKMRRRMKAYWASMTPEQRKAEVRRRKLVFRGNTPSNGSEIPKQVNGTKPHRARYIYVTGIYDTVTGKIYKEVPNLGEA